MRRAVRGTGAAVVVAIAIGVVAAYAIARRSLPRYDGAVDVAGASAPIQIVRDRGAVPHIFASTRRDALFGLGYVHAQDRLWQMEFQRRIGYGRLSEVFGRATLPQDRFLRTVGFGRAARSAWEHLPDDTRQDVDAYVAGVNAFLATHHGTRLPPEFNLLRVEPERWSGPDVIVWQKMMAWDLSKNFSYELLRDDMAAEVGAAKMAALMPPYEADGLSILTARDMPWLEKSSLAQSSVAQGFRPAMPRRPDGPHDGSTASAFVSALAGGSPSVARLLLDPMWLLRTWNVEWKKSQWGNAAAVTSRFAADLGE